MEIKHTKGGFLSLFICSILVLTLLSTGVGVVSAADPIISLKPAVKEVNVNEDFTVFIEVDPNGNAVETALLDLTYDPTKVSITEVVMNGVDFPINFPGETPVAGKITKIMGLNTAATGLTTVANLAEIQMHADAAGTFTVGISGKLTKPPKGDPLTPITMNSGEVRIEGTGDSLGVTVLYPNGGESIPIGTQVQVSAHATDDGAVTGVTFYYSTGLNWNSIGAGTRVSGTAKDGTWDITWDTNGLSAGTSYKIKAVASDGTSTSEDQSDSAFSLISNGIEEIELLWELSVDTHIRDIAFGDINRDGITDVVASVVDCGSIGWSVVGIKGNSGEVLWEFSQTQKVSDVEVGDINGDGSLEVILLDWDNTIYVLNGVNGQLLWSKSLTLKSLTINSHEVFGSEGKSLKVEDIGHDRIAEIVVGYGDIILLDGDGNVVWTFQGDDHLGCIDIGDLNNDGYEDIVTTSMSRSDGESAVVYAISGKEGSRLWAYNIPPFKSPSTHSCSPQGISIATLSDNSKYVAVVFGLSSTDDSASYQISAINGTTGTELWKYVDDMPPFGLDVTTGDLNGDGLDDVLQIGNDVVALDNKGKVLWKSPYLTEAAIVFDMIKDGNPKVCMEYAIYSGINGELVTQLPIKDGEIIGGMKVVGVKDITGDSYPEVITGHHPSTGVRAFTVVHPVPEFDTRASANSYPSIPGTHKGTITPNQDITVQKLYTYPCAGTGGHTESVRIYGYGIDESASWTGYDGDWHNITFDSSFTLLTFTPHV